MTAILRNFVTTTTTKGDLLSPTDYTSIVGMIMGLLDKGHHKDLALRYKDLQKHLIDFENPHHDGEDGFRDEIIAKTYAIYTNMLESPLSLVDFKTLIVPSTAFLELTRRIVLNRYLYDQVKLPDGSVPVNTTARLTEDWAQPVYSKAVTALTFTAGITNETDFIRSGWGVNTLPIGVIFTAKDLLPPADFPIVFDSSNPATARIEEGQLTHLFPLNLANNNLTVRLQGIGTPPPTKLTLFSLKNSGEQINLNVLPDRRMELAQGATTLLTTTDPIEDGHIEFAININGNVSLTNWQPKATVIQTARILLNHDAPFTLGLIGIPMESASSATYALRSVTVLAGCAPIPDPISVSIPSGYTVVTESDGAWMFDPDGAVLVDFDVRLPAGYAFVTDNDGMYLQDSDGSFFIDLI